MATFDLFRKGYKHVVSKLDDRTAYMKCYSDFGENVGKVYDYQVADYTKKHMRLIDRLNFRKVATGMLMSFSILSQSVEEPTKKNWKYFKDL